MFWRFMIVCLFVQGANAFAVPTEGHEMMMAAPSAYAIDAGRSTLEKGGNVVDVAVTMALALSVTSPYFASLGGGGFAMVKSGDAPVEALDFREKAPAATNQDYFVKLNSPLASREGGTAVGVPGIPAGLYALHKKFGHLPWTELFRPAERLASSGFRVSGEWARNTERSKHKFTEGGLSRFFGKNKTGLLPGDELKQADLEDALRLLKNEGPKGFYAGPVAADIVQSVAHAGGVLTAKDLSDYQVRWLKPMETNFAGYHLYLMPPPSSGGVVIQTALALVEKAKMEKRPFLSVEELHWLAEIESRSFRGRSLLGDPDFNKNPISFLLSKNYIQSLFASIKDKRATSLPALKVKDVPKESTETTHFSVLDAKGNAVSMTITLNGDYGSGVVSEKYGISLNDEMDDFTTIPAKQNMFGLIQGEGNNVQPGKRPLSSMSPALAEKDGRVMLAIGAPGGPRIISAVFQGIYRILGQGLDVDRAIQAPRIHHQFEPNVLTVDKERLSPDVLDRLRKMGHEIDESSVGRVFAVKRNDKGVLEAAFDSRGEGAAGGQ